MDSGKEQIFSKRKDKFSKCELVLRPFDVLKVCSVDARKEDCRKLLKAQGINLVVFLICTTQGLVTATHLVVNRAIAGLFAENMSPVAVASHIGIYAGLYVLSAITQELSAVCEGQWSQNVYRQFISQSLNLNSGRVDLWASPQRRDEFGAMMGPNAQGVIAGSTAQMAQLMAATVGFVMSAGELSLMLNPVVGVASMVSAALACALSILKCDPGQFCDWPCEDNEMISPELWTGFLAPTTALALEKINYCGALLSKDWALRLVGEAVS